MLALRPTGMHSPPAYADLKDYWVFQDDKIIGRVYELRPLTPPRWFWWMFAHNPRRPLKTSGQAATLEDAKAQLNASWESPAGC